MSWFCVRCCPRDIRFENEGFPKAACDHPSLPLQVIMKGMSLGTVMYKVRTADRWYRRKYRVDIQNMRLSYSPSTKPFWKGKITTVDLFDLEEVRKGWNTDVFNKLEAKFRRKLQATLHPQLRSKLKEENCFSLIIGPAHSVVDLIAPNVHARDAWVKGLSQLIACCKHQEQEHDEERWLKEQFRKADINGNGSLNFDECLDLLNRLNISMRRKEAKKLFDASNFRKVKIDGKEALEPDEFIHFYRNLTHRPELEDLMKQYSVSQAALWSAEELQNFLNQEQAMTATLEDCETLIEEYEPEENRINGYLSLQGLQALMLSADHDIFNKRHRLIYQDMTRPLSHYFIASSHNTYLIQGQLIGDSSIEGYIQALKKGCRCLELDTWDGPDGEPIIFHGYTLTSRIFFRDVLEAIKQYAFVTSQFPVILSIENHCSIPQQMKMAEHFVNILGDFLYKDSVIDEETQYPSPEKLARKILIKGKKLRSPQAADGVMMSPEMDELLEDEEEKEATLTAALAAASVDGEDNEYVPMAASARYHAVAEELSNLVNYFSPRRFHSFDECSESWKFYEMASFQETVALNLAKEQGADFVVYNKYHFSRIYPKGTRTDSSNYDPVPYWNMGCQLVALNYQTRDNPMYINDARFAQNGKCGYVLKPEYLIGNRKYDPLDVPVPGQQTYVTIKVISGQFLPKPNRAEDGEVIDPYVSIKVKGHQLDVQKKKTNWINNNGFNPKWNETLKFELKAPELDVFHFRVKTVNVTSNALIGQFALPYTSICQGYRYIHLEDVNGQSLHPATIFVHIEITYMGQFRKASKIK